MMATEVTVKIVAGVDTALASLASAMVVKTDW